jgi:copper resistance protein B
MQFILIILLLGHSAFAQHTSHDHEEAQPNGPLKVTGMQKYAVDENGEAPKKISTHPIDDNPLYGFLYIDRLEEKLKGDEDTLLWDLMGRFGNQYHRLYFESEGEYNTSMGKTKDSRNELLYGYSYLPFWDIQAGYRRDLIPEKADRDFGVLSVLGLAPFLFEVDAATYVSSKGDLSAILEVEYSLLLTQRTQLIPRLELEASLQEVKDYSVGRGLNGFEVGIRLSHQIIREIAPYIGLSWERKTFGTKDLVEQSGEDSSVGVFLVGVRIII